MPVTGEPAGGTALARRRISLVAGEDVAEKLLAVVGSRDARRGGLSRLASRPDGRALFGRELHVGALFRRLPGRLPDLARVRDPHPAAAFEVEMDLT